METILIICFTLLSCLLFERTDIAGVTRNLIASYREQFVLMQNKSIGDEEKQKLLLSQVGKQVRLLFRLIASLLAFVSPFILYAILAPYFRFMNSETLYQLPGILSTFAGVVVYLILKKLYVELLRK